MKKLLQVTLFASLLLASCKKETPAPTPAKSMSTISFITSRDVDSAFIFDNETGALCASVKAFQLADSCSATAVSLEVGKTYQFKEKYSSGVYNMSAYKFELSASSLTQTGQGSYVVSNTCAPGEHVVLFDFH